MFERHRPGWKMYVIDGLAGNRFAIYHKVHHALVDGESGMAILRKSLATSPRDRRIRATVGVTQKQRPRPAPEGLRAALESEARRLAGKTLSVSRGSLRVFEQAIEGLRGFSVKQTRAFTAPHTLMNDPIYNARSITHTVFELQAHEGGRARLGCDAERRRAHDPRCRHQSLPEARRATLPSIRSWRFARSRCTTRT